MWNSHDEVAFDVAHGGPALRFKDPSGTTIELTTGVNTPVPMGSAVTARGN
jgi:hypothetical protein